MDSNINAKFVGQLLEFAFPQTHPRTIAAAAVCGNRQIARLGIAFAADIVPPTADRLNGKLCGIMVDADADPAEVGGQIVNAIRYRAAKLLDQEVIYPDFFAVALRAPLPPGILEVANKLFLLCIHRYDRLLLDQSAADTRVDVNELRITIRVAGAFTDFSIGLQTKLLGLEQFANDGVADLVPDLA